jgi:hypothetical protein
MYHRMCTAAISGHFSTKRYKLCIEDYCKSACIRHVATLEVDWLLHTAYTTLHRCTPPSGIWLVPGIGEILGPSKRSMAFMGAVSGADSFAWHGMVWQGLACNIIYSIYTA